MSILHTIDAVLPLPGSLTAGLGSIALGIWFALYYKRILARVMQALLFLRYVVHRPIVIEEDWRLRARTRQEEVGPEMTLEQVLRERIRSDNALYEKALRRKFGVFLFCDDHGGVATLPFKDARKAA